MCVWCVCVCVCCVSGKEKLCFSSRDVQLQHRDSPRCLEMLMFLRNRRILPPPASQAKPASCHVDRTLLGDAKLYNPKRRAAAKIRSPPGAGNTPAAERGPRSNGAAAGGGGGGAAARAGGRRGRDEARRPARRGAQRRQRRRGRAGARRRRASRRRPVRQRLRRPQLEAAAAATVATAAVLARERSAPKQSERAGVVTFNKGRKRKMCPKRGTF
ncbi:Protein of unknown function [Gryllus bimaculatus]|nr:Protein of unknown function [Gryllus bimaculatus]